MFEVVQVAERNLRSSLLVLGDEFMSTHGDASLFFRRGIYCLKEGAGSEFPLLGVEPLIRSQISAPRQTTSRKQLDLLAF